MHKRAIVARANVDSSSIITVGIRSHSSSAHRVAANLRSLKILLLD
jgi:hypothetical protein